MPLRSDLAYALCRHLLVGPALRAHGRPEIVGRENVPRSGPVILAANHLAILDSFYLALAAGRSTTFLAKSEYFDGPGIGGALRRHALSVLGQIPVDRRGGAAASPALDAARRIVESGGVWGIHPEGTRSPDGRLYRGRTGAVRVALQTGAPLVPVAIMGTGPTPRQRRRVTVEMLPPLNLTPYRQMGPAGVRLATDTLMQTIGRRTGQTYVDAYARTWAPVPHRPDAA